MKCFYLCISLKKTMAQIEDNNRNKSKRYSANKSIRVDLTPMVDLGFLLITFFILTTTLSEPTIAKLVLPKDVKINRPVKNSAVLTLELTRNDSVEYFEGPLKKNATGDYCSYKNLRGVIQQKQKEVASVLGDRKETIILIYAEAESTYKNFMDVMDEIQINDVSHYYVMN